MIYNKFNMLFRFSILIVIFLLWGCGTNAKNINKIEKGYDKRVTEINLKMVEAGKLQHRVVITERWIAPKVTPEFQAKMLKEAASAIREIKVLAPVDVAKALEVKGVKIKQSGELAQTSLFIAPHFIDSSNYESVRSHYIWFQVILHDNTMDKDVWSGEFRVFVSINASGIFVENIEGFAKSIVEQMAKSELL